MWDPNENKCKKVEELFTLVTSSFCMFQLATNYVCMSHYEPKTKSG